MRSRRPTRPLDEATQTRDLFVLLLGLCGLAVGVAFGFVAATGDVERAAFWAAWAVPCSAAVSAVLASDIVHALSRRRPWSIVLLRLGLLGINAVLFIAELMVLILARSHPT